MSLFKNILVPVDLSEFNRNSIAVATNLAKANDAKLIFCYVALPPLPADAIYAKEDFEALLAKEKNLFNEVMPEDCSVKYDRVFKQGNPGPDIIRIAEQRGCDLIVLATHGRTGLLRWLMGSVAEYVTRHSKCPVLTLRMPAKSARIDSPNAPANGEDSDVDKVAPEESATVAPKPPHEPGQSTFVTTAMQHSSPIHSYDPIEKIAAELEETRTSAAPVIDGLHKCIGVLTTSDIQHYFQLKKRLDEKDESVLDEVFEVDEFGMRRANLDSFKLVKRHMTTPVVTVDAMATCDDARKILAERNDIHHLVVVDADSHPLGIVDTQRLMKA